MDEPALIELLETHGTCLHRGVFSITPEGLRSLLAAISCTRVDRFKDLLRPDTGNGETLVESFQRRRKK